MWKLGNSLLNNLWVKKKFFNKEKLENNLKCVKIKNKTYPKHIKQDAGRAVPIVKFIPVNAFIKKNNLESVT